MFTNPNSRTDWFDYYVGVCLSIIRTLYLHPLHNLPGPKTWIAFPILRYISLVRGRLDIDMLAFQNKYGEAVRFGRDQVSITDQAWKDIYTHGHADQQLPEVLHSTSNPSEIISATNADHCRFHRAFSHAFSARGLQPQEPILRGYIDKLIRRLDKIATSSTPYNLTGFDLIGDLAFGEPFGGLDSGEYHHWVATIFKAVQGMVFVKLRDSYPLLFRIISPWFASKSLMVARERQIEYSTQTVRKRLQSTLSQMEANANILIIAGSETTVTLLSGVTYWLLRTPDALRKYLPYMLACLTEALRIYPPAPGGLERITLPPNPVNIRGYMIAPGKKVSVHQSAAYRSPLNFHRASEYLPEQWLPCTKEDLSSPFYHNNCDVLQPFSVGPRNCIGRNLANAEMRLILTRVLWKFDLELCPESATRWDEQRSFILWEKKPLMCSVRRIEGSGLGVADKDI
ncbi:hypothetical protein ASPSYDRAFT_82014 [Aspergillus sydowii CBS 593.65]|uniref:Cytochrome P450 n=1 Tax=Aspergillus sydowii CBS 593.65 TaxID=1036612 RepID=A0A1L9T4R5_9EURO|nr:uncharacterized protein ASPSYDRAFT_82014 [Aspergillus sydowii CBS 593.65]OJJ54398.1 hypothetical protein ASPSYDRAFT_82014 [Aspergillus sydowii CBS 593.65]